MTAPTRRSSSGDGMGRSTLRRRHNLLLLCALAGLYFMVAVGQQRHLNFTEPRVASSTRGAGVPRAVPEVARSGLLRWLPALAITSAGASPSFGESGVTKAWGTRPDGSEDEIHTGGVEWEDIKVGTGASPKIGDLVSINFVATCTVKEREVVIDDSKGTARDYRFGVGQMLVGMDEGIYGMRTGGKRKLQIPGNLAFGKRALPSKVGRPAIPPNSPVTVEVSLDFIPGSDEVYEYAQDAKAAK